MNECIVGGCQLGLRLICFLGREGTPPHPSAFLNNLILKYGRLGI